MAGALIILALLAVCSLATAKIEYKTVYFQEKFDDGEKWESRWVPSEWKKKDGTAGDFKLTAGQWYGDAEEDKGIQTGPDARFFAITSKMEKEFDNTGKDLVVQLQVKHEQKIDCGGGYIKLLEGEVDQKAFSGDTPYSIMFGPDICGYSTKRVHAIITYKGKNLLIKKTVECETDELSHVYTFVLHPDNTYKILIDNEVKESGSLYEDWDFLPAKEISDPEAKKPADWVDEEFMDDPEDKKPEGYDDIPSEIVDPEAKKPEDWNDEDDGEWEAPLIPNPDYKGEWAAKRIKNPEYKGKWSAPLIANPDYEHDPEVYKLPPLNYVGFELWQVKAGTIFDNILVTDDVEFAKKFAEDTWGKNKEGEKKMFDEIQKKKEAEEEEERKKMEDAEPEEGEEGDEDMDDDIPEDDDAEDDAAEDLLEAEAAEKDHDEL